jgi:DNA-binding IclR family transcriptional regulator
MADHIQSVGRALRILQLLAAHPQGLTVREISKLAQLNVSTAHHLVNTLRAEGYVANFRDSSYRLGSAVARLYGGFVATIQPDPRLLDTLHWLATETRETAYVGFWHNDEVVIQAIVEGSQAVRVGGLHVGYSGHSHARASGKVLLAHLDGRQLEAYLATHSLVPLTPHTIRTEEALRAQLDQIRTQGYAVDLEEFAEGVCCVAAPVFSPEGLAAAALTVSAPSWRFARVERHLIDLVTRAARDGSPQAVRRPSYA